MAQDSKLCLSPRLRSCFAANLRPSILARNHRLKATTPDLRLAVRQQYLPGSLKRRRLRRNGTGHCSACRQATMIGRLVGGGLVTPFAVHQDKVLAALTRWHQLVNMTVTPKKDGSLGPKMVRWRLCVNGCQCGCPKRRACVGLFVWPTS